jgi:hypothetical protein
MDRQEIMAMDGQELCNWLNERCVFSETNETIRQFYTNGRPIKWNLPACAFAAKRYMINGNTEPDFVSALKYQYKGTNIDWVLYNELDWLRAAAVVISENQEP